ncbi:hypothetical protein ACOSQ3_005207 [Xanthoceras sorbifolium]
MKTPSCSMKCPSADSSVIMLLLLVTKLPLLVAFIMVSIMLIIPVQAKLGKSHSELGMKDAKSSSRKSLSEQVCNLSINWNIPDINLMCCNFFSEKIHINFNMLHSSMKQMVLSKSLSTYVITPLGRTWFQTKIKFMEHGL